jgi:type I restriction enzyme S subunit
MEKILKIWDKKKLGNIADIIMGQSPKSQYYNSESIGYPLIQGNADIYKRKTWPKKHTSELTKKCKVDDIIMSVRAPVGIIAKSIHEACIGRGVCAIRSIRCNNEYLYQYLISIEKKWKDVSQGSTFESINSEDIKNIFINIPSIEEQEKISNILSKVDENIENVDNIITKTKELKKGLMQELLTKGIDHTEYKETEIGRIPVDWEIEKLEYIFDRVTRKNVEKNNNVMTISAIDGLISQKEFFNKIVAGKDIEKYYLLKKGEFAYNKSYSKGYPMGVIRRLNRYEKGILSVLYICFKFKDNTKDMNSDYVNYIFANNFFDDQLSQIAQEGARAHGLLNVSVHEFFKMQMAIPPLEEQEKIVKILLSLDNQIEVYEKKKEKITELKEGLMQKLLTGKIRVKI